MLNNSYIIYVARYINYFEINRFYLFVSIQFYYII